jgi:hypothetical protein
VIYAHEFHYSKLENINPKTRYAYKVLRGVGVDNKHDGILMHNLLATYTHLPLSERSSKPIKYWKPSSVLSIVKCVTKPCASGLCVASAIIIRGHGG